MIDMIWVVLFAAAIIILAISLYNRLISLAERVKNAWAQVEVQLKRRYDLIPNLVSTVQGYSKHERETFEQITKARAEAINASGPADTARAENQLTSTLRSLFAVAENYPELKADTNFRHLQEELANTESKIAFARQFYNDTVQKYNIQVQVFPANLLANSMGFEEKSFFDLDDNPDQREAVQVRFP